MFCPARILVPVDFSDGSRAAYDYARDVARAFGSAVDLLHVVASPMTQKWGQVSQLGELGDEVRAWHRDAMCDLDSFSRDGGRPATRTTMHVRAGVAAQTIVDYAREHACDLIVMGAHAFRGVADLMRGNTTERVLRLAECPVLAVPASAETIVQPWMVTDEGERAALSS
jgi:nucleotide-binding universal stress UspA family protein